MERRPDLVRIDDFGVARPVDRGAVQRFKGAKGTYRLLPGPPRFVLLEKHAESGEDFIKLRLGGEITAPGMLCDVVGMVASSGWRGELIVWSTIGASDSAARSIFFEGGNVLGAQSTAAGERLGEIMYKLGALDRDQVLAVTSKATPNRRFGETAVDLGLIPRQRLFELVRTQTEEIVYEALRCSEGTFWFIDGFDPSRLAYRHRVSAQALLMEGVRRMDESQYFRERIPSSAHVPAKLPSRRQPSADLVAVFRECDGRRSVSEIARTCGITEFEATHALYRLATGGFLQIESPHPTSPEGIAEIFNGAIRVILKSADEIGRGREVREHLATFASSAGIYDALFRGAGPASDGAIDPARVAGNLPPLAGDDPNASLSRWLHDYLSFALFDATTEMPRDRARKLSDELSEAIAQLAPKTGPASVYPPSSPAIPISVPPEKPAPPPRPRPPHPPPSAFAKTQIAAAPPPPVLRDELPSPPPPAQLPRLEPLPGNGAERLVPNATQIAIAHAPPHEAIPSPVFATAPVDAASDLARSRRVERRRAIRTLLLVIAILLLAGAAIASLFVFEIVRLPGSEQATEQPTPKPPKPKASSSPATTKSAPPPVEEAPSSVASPAPSPKPAPRPPSDLAATQGRILPKGPAGFRVFVDGKVAGETPGPIVVTCGLRTVKIGSHGSEQKISIPCGGEIDVYAK